MILTKKRVLTSCAELWGWLAKTGALDKGKWPGWAENGGDWPGAMFDCPCCEYADRKGSRPHGQSRTCIKICLLRDLWPEGCCRDGTAYNRWVAESERFSKPDKATLAKHARKIQAKCLELLGKNPIALHKRSEAKK